MPRSLEMGQAKPAARGSRTKKDALNRLLDAAELLFAEHGLNGVSLRQIGVAAGGGNNSVIQYHFGSKAGLIRAIIERRVESFEARRVELLAEAKEQVGAARILALLKAVALPLAEAEDPYGRHVYAHFLLQFDLNFRYHDGLEHPGWGEHTAAYQAVMLLAEVLPTLSQRDLSTRIGWVGRMFLCALIERDNARANGKPIKKEKQFLEEIFNAMLAVMQV